MEISSIEKYIKAIMEMKRNKDKLELQANQWFFRGQKNSSWSAMPSVFRNDCLNKEYQIILKAVGQNPFEFKSLTEFETLTKLQHYGLATRLLDVTLNPLVALFFATEPAVEYEGGKDKRFKQVEKDGMIFYQYAPVHFLNELSVRIATVLPFIDFSEIKTVQQLLQYLYENRIVSESERDLLKNDNYDYLINCIQNNYYVVSSHSNERLIRQSGAFILPTSIIINGDQADRGDRKIEKATSSLNKEFESDCFIVPAKDKAKIREELDFFNINEASLFPELEHQMDYLQQKNKAELGSVPQFQPLRAEISEEEKYNLLQPNVEKIIREMVPDLSHIACNEIVAFVNEQIRYVDWKEKEQIRSNIRLNIKKILQREFSANDSIEKTKSILELLLKPTEGFIAEEKNIDSLA